MNWDGLEWEDKMGRGNREGDEGGNTGRDN